MAICMIVENESDRGARGAGVPAPPRHGAHAPEGARLVVTGPADPGWRVISVWDSAEARDRFFAERLSAAYESAGLSFENSHGPSSRSAS